MAETLYILWNPNPTGESFVCAYDKTGKAIAGAISKNLFEALRDMGVIYPLSEQGIKNWNKYRKYFLRGYKIEIVYYDEYKRHPIMSKWND